MRVLIIGGGIGGPALATLLQRQGVAVTLIEKSPEWRDIGFGLSMWGNGRKVLRELGIDAELAEHGYEVPFIRAFSVDGSQTSQDLQFENFKDLGGPLLIVPRAKLHELVLRDMSKVDVRLGTSIESFTQSEREVEVVFTNGVKEKFDLVVGADGVTSRTRELLFGPEDLRRYGWRFWVFWVPPGAPVDPYAFSVSAPVSAMGFWPLHERGFIGMGQFGQATDKVDTRSLLEFFKPFLTAHGWREEHFETVLANAENDFFDEIRYVKMGPWYKGRVALLGDARHAFAPVIGQGASLALEDAHVLAEELGRCKDIPEALKAYAARRDGRVRRMRAFSTFVEGWAKIRSPWLVQARDKVGPLIPKRVLVAPLRRLLREEV